MITPRSGKIKEVGDFPFPRTVEYSISRTSCLIWLILNSKSGKMGSPLAFCSPSGRRDQAR